MDEHDTGMLTAEERRAFRDLARECGAKAKNAIMFNEPETALTWLRAAEVADVISRGRLS